MRTFFGFLQFVFGIGGVIALFNAQWVAMIAAWVAAGAVGWIGNRIVKGAMGVSQSGQEAMANIPRAIDQLKRGSFAAAEGTTLGAVNSFRMGGDKELLAMALVLRAVALGANEKFDLARKAADEAEALTRSTSRQFQELHDMVRPLALHVQRELRGPRPNSSRLVSEFLELNDSF
jgi:hypothetical protein